MPAGLGQFRSDGVTPVPVGGAPGGPTLVLKATVSDGNGDPVKLQVEARAIGTAFTDVATHESGLVASGAVAAVTVADLASGTRYHWQARAVDASGAPSAWVPFGGNAESAADFTLPTFADVAPTHPFWPWIEALVRAGITAGCASAPPAYCPAETVSRAQMAVFLLRGIHGAGHTPPPPDGTFADVPSANPFAAWIEELFAENITGGCATGPLRFCPGQAVSRDQMAVFLLRAIHGAAYQPPPAVGTFADVPVAHPLAAWIEQLVREGVSAGCAASPARYCPGDPVTRGQMAVFLVRAFQLPL
jgi:hypothetical protein